MHLHVSRATRFFEHVSEGLTNRVREGDVGDDSLAEEGEILAGRAWVEDDGSPCRAGGLFLSETTAERTGASTRHLHP